MIRNLSPAVGGEPVEQLDPEGPGEFHVAEDDDLAIVGAGDAELAGGRVAG